jgi:hypothetical protein
MFAIHIANLLKTPAVRTPAMIIAGILCQTPLLIEVQASADGNHRSFAR